MTRSIKREFSFSQLPELIINLLDGESREQFARVNCDTCMEQHIGKGSSDIQTCAAA